MTKLEIAHYDAAISVLLPFVIGLMRNKDHAISGEATKVIAKWDSIRNQKGEEKE